MFICSAVKNVICTSGTWNAWGAIIQTVAGQKINYVSVIFAAKNVKLNPSYGLIEKYIPIRNVFMNATCAEGGICPGIIWNITFWWRMWMESHNLNVKIAKKDLQERSSTLGTKELIWMTFHSNVHIVTRNFDSKPDSAYVFEVLFYSSIESF